jgi:hypothetical protein
MKKLVILLAGIAIAFGALAQSELEAQRAAMEKLAWMAGAWEGISTSRERDGEKQSVSYEWIRRAGGGLAIMIQGRHYRRLPDGARGDVVLDTAGMMTYDPATSKYRFVTQLQDGKGGTHEAVMQGDTLSWKIALSNAHIRYDITRSAKGEWSELGYFCRDGAACVPFFKMLLERKGDAP